MGLKAGRVGIHPSQVDPITGMLLNGPTPGSISLEDLSDAQISNPEVGQTLIYNGTGWENEFSSISPVTPATLASLQDVALSSVSNDQILRYNSTASKWENEDMPTIPAAQVNSDWNAASGVAQILNKPSIPSKTSDLQNDSGFITISSVPTTITALQDVQITDPEDGDYLIYDSANSKWINSGEAPAPSYTDITVTLYGAVEDTISFTDVAGISHTEVFTSGQSSKSVTFKINPSGSTSITFTSAVAKDPSNLSNDYTKTVSITSATTSIYVMPNDNVLYWYGYIDSNCEDCTSANGWSGANAQPTHNLRDITLSGGASAIGSNTAISSTKGLCVYQMLTGTGYLETVSTKNFNNVVNYKALSSSSIAKEELTITQNSYLAMYIETSGSSMKVHALWYE